MDTLCLFNQMNLIIEKIVNKWIYVGGMGLAHTLAHHTKIY
jgi:hypothetical protein